MFTTLLCTKQYNNINNKKNTLLKIIIQVKLLYSYINNIQNYNNDIHH